MMLSKKIQALKPSAVQAISAQAKKQMAQGKDVLNLSVGEPTWECFESTQQTAVKSIQKGCSRYSPASGQIELRKAIANNLNQHLHLNYDSKNITVAIGAKFCLFSALQALVDPADEVLIPAPYWVSYPSMTALIGARTLIVETNMDTHKLTADILQHHLSKQSKVLILNSPNNPSGSVYSLEELKSLGEVIQSFPNLFVLSDDIYDRMALNGPADSFAPHILEAYPKLKDRVICINAASKNYAMPGWRLGWAAGPEPVIQAMSAFQSQTVSSAPTIAQMAMIPTFENAEKDVQKTHQFLKAQREKNLPSPALYQRNNFSRTSRSSLPMAQRRRPFWKKIQKPSYSILHGCLSAAV